MSGGTAPGGSVRGLLATAPIPVHMLAGPLARGLLRAVLGIGVVVRLAAIPGVLWLGRGALPVVVPALLVLLGLVAWLHRRPRHIAHPLRDEAIFLLGCAAIAVAGRGCGGGMAWWAVAGALGAVGAVVAWALGMHASWGWAPGFVQMRQPRFRVLGDNPDSLTFVCRARVSARGLWVRVPPGRGGPVTLAATELRTLSVTGSLGFREVDPVLARGAARLYVGPAPPSDGTADLVLLAPPGRVVLSVRYYRPVRVAGGQPLPTIVAEG